MGQVNGTRLCNRKQEQNGNPMIAHNAQFIGYANKNRYVQKKEKKKEKKRKG